MRLELSRFWNVLCSATQCLCYILLLQFQKSFIFLFKSKEVSCLKGGGWGIGEWEGKDRWWFEQTCLIASCLHNYPVYFSISNICCHKKMDSGNRLVDKKRDRNRGQQIRSLPVTVCHWGLILGGTLWETIWNTPVPLEGRKFGAFIHQLSSPVVSRWPCGLNSSPFSTCWS